MPLQEHFFLPFVPFSFSFKEVLFNIVYHVKHTAPTYSFESISIGIR